MDNPFLDQPAMELAAVRDGLHRVEGILMGNTGDGGIKAVAFAALAVQLGCIPGWLDELLKDMEQRRWPQTPHEAYEQVKEALDELCARKERERLERKASDTR